MADEIHQDVLLLSSNMGAGVILILKIIAYIVSHDVWELWSGQHKMVSKQFRTYF